MNKPKMTVTAVERSLAIRTQLNDIVNELVQDFYSGKITLNDLEGVTSILNNPRDCNPIKNMAHDLTCRAVGIIEQEEQRTNA